MGHRGGEQTTGLDELATEAWNADGADLDLRSTRELVELMNSEDVRVPAAVAEAADAIAQAIESPLAASGGDAKVAIVLLLSRTDAATARARLVAVNGVIRKALDQ